MSPVDIFTPGPVEAESRFTLATKTCPHPEWWHSTDADSTEVEVSEMIAGLVRALQPQIVIETGSAWGQTTGLIRSALHANGHGHLHTIEPDAERAEFVQGTCADTAYVTVHEMKSLDFTPPGPVDFAFFDSLVSLRVPEFAHFYEHPGYSPGAFVVFHDTADHQGPLWSQITELEEQGILLPVRLPTPRGVVIAEVVG